MPIRLIAASVLIGVWSAAVLPARDDDGELAPGLMAEYQSGGRSVQRIDGDLAFDWTNGSPDFRLPAGPLSARWSGQILLRTEGRYRWHAFLQGELSIRIQDRVVFSASSKQPQWLSGDDVELSFGEFSLEISFQSPDGGRLFLCWSSDSFPLEPLPHHALFHVHTDLPSGPLLPAAVEILNHRCDRCHGELAGLSSSPAPSLKQIGVETSGDWLIDQIQHGGGKRGQMPAFGFTRPEAEAIFAALRSRVTSTELPDSTVTDPPAAKEVEAGRDLLISTGCLACHAWQQQGRVGEFGGPPLDDVSKHRTAKWLEQWLSDPAKLNPQHRMPVFTLSNDERRQIVSALRGEQPTIEAASSITTSTPEQLSLGNRLIQEARCANCHELPDSAARPASTPPWSDLKFTEDGCWSTKSVTASRRPAFEGLDIDRLRHDLRELVGRSTRLSDDALGAALLIQKGCVNCHDRDGRKGISTIAADLAKPTPSLEGRTMYLIPPQLTAVGDRLPTERLAKAIRGELSSRRLDWLLVRMPQYQHTEAEQSAIISHLKSHDRIPDHAPASPEYPLTPGTEATLAGRELIGGKGFSCVACHPVKDFTPKNVALGTRGSNLFRIGERLRPEYFFRWTRSPLRVMPGVEMPGYQRPHPTIFPGDMNRQLAAIWTALNDPDLPTPVNPGAVEQYWTVGPNDPPRILRDVVTLPGKKQVTVPRAFAVGFPNGHNLLFDLNTASLRAWTIGDFAQQRTQGKSWFWDLVGSPVMVNVDGQSDYLVTTNDKKTVLYPTAGSKVRLLDCVVLQHPQAIDLSYELTYPLPQGIKGPQTKIIIQERWRPKEQGWTRQILADCAKDGYSGVSGEYYAVLHLMEPFPEQPGKYELSRNLVERPMISPLDRRRGFEIHHNPRGFAVPQGAFGYTSQTPEVNAAAAGVKTTYALAEPVTVVPGFRGERLAYPTTIMPTAMTFNYEGNLLFTSLKGHVYRGDDQAVTLFAEGLAAPFGILESLGMVLVSHKPEILGLTDRDDDGFAETSQVIATGWGLTDDYHDWTCGLVRDAAGNLFTTLGSDYADKDRPSGTSRWRGNAIRIDPAGNIESLARGLRFPTGVAMTSREDIFVTDQQGIQNTFNELNWLDHQRPEPRTELRFGVPSLYEPDKEAPSLPPAVQIPHPWTRSVNGICAIPKSLADRTHPKLFDQILGCEYDNKALIRLSWQLVDGVMQGAAYPFSKPAKPGDPQGFLGPMSIAVSQNGDIYVGSIHDSGWQGGLNTGDIVKLTPEKLPNGLCEIRLTPTGFDLEFFHSLEKSRAEDTSKYQISGYTRVWQGSYATPDSGRHAVEVHAATLSEDGTTVSLSLSGLKPGHVYDVAVGEIGSDADGPLWPNLGFYTLHRLPK